MKKGNRVLAILEVIELVLSIIAVILLTLLFRYETSNNRYIFLMVDCYVIYLMSKTITEFTMRIQRRRIIKQELDSFPKKVSF